MIRRFLLPILASLIAAAPLSAQLDFLEQLTSNVNIQGLETYYDFPAGIAKAKGNVSIAYEDMKLTAGEAEFHYDTGDIHAKNNVVIYKGDSVYKGDRVTYNVKTGRIRSDSLRSGLSPLFFESSEYESETDNVEVLENRGVIVTTHDSANPNYHIRAEELDIFPDDRIVFRKAKLYVGDTPIFYLPYLSQPLDEDLGYFFQPGFNTRWGVYLLNRYGFYISDHTLAQVHVDFRSARGLAGGIDLFSLRHRGNSHYGHLGAYYIQDSDPTYSFDVTNARTEAIPEERYRIDFHHRIFLPGPEASTFYLDFDITKVSDSFLYYDFFFQELQTDPRPDNIINLVKSHERGTLSVLARLDLNDWARTDTRSPEIALDFTTQPIFNTGLFYRGETSFGILAEELGEKDERSPVAFNADTVNTEGFNRLHTYHEVLYPINNVAGFLNVVPRVGGGVTSYSDLALEDTDSESRSTFHAGVDVSFKMSKVYPDVQSKRFGLDSLRHIVQPYVNYSYLASDNIAEMGILPIDRLIPTTRLRPIDVPLFTAVDDLRDWDIARLGVRNYWQTKRDEKSYNWLGINSYIDYYLEDPEYDRDISNLYNDLFWRPVPWLNLTLDTQIPLDDNPANYTEFNTKVVWMPTDSHQIAFGHLFLQDHPILQDSSLLSLATYWRINDNWGFGTNHRYEMDDSFLESQSYKIYRDLTSWTASLGFIEQGARGAQDNDYGIILTLTLKAFPQVGLPLDFNPNPTEP